MATIDPRKRKVVSDIITRLHHGLSVEDAKTEILRDVGKLSSSEITEIEQGLINEGVSPDEIRRFCNVHALLFESALEQTVASPDAPTHPVNMLKRENREIEKLVQGLRGSAARLDKAALESGIARLRGVIGHYDMKENALFPYLEKHGFPGPSKVMWSKHNEVREMMKKISDPSQTDRGAPGDPPGRGGGNDLQGGEHPLPRLPGTDQRAGMGGDLQGV